MAKFVVLLIASSLSMFSIVAHADDAEMIQLQHSAHVCNDEQETQRLAANDQLREMAKALVEFKATKFCFIIQPSTVVALVEHKGSYVKFKHNNKVLYAFAEDLQAQQLPAQDMGTQAAIE